MSSPNPRHLTEKEMLRFLDKSELAQKILAYISKSATRKQLRIKIGVPIHTILYHLVRFEEHGMVKCAEKYKKIYTLTEVGWQYVEKIRPKIWHLL